MSIIFSNSSYDPSADEVIAWIQYKGNNPVRLSEKDIHNGRIAVKIGTEDTTFSCKDSLLFDVLFSNNRQESVWFRGWADHETTIRNICHKDLDDNEKINLSVLTYKHLNDERTHFYNWLINRITRSHRSLNKHGIFTVNKLEILNISREIGLIIPDTLITNNRNDSIMFLREKGRIICKPISEVFTYQTESNQLYLMYTEEVFEEDIKSLPEKHGLTLFQELLDKVFDIRIHFLDGEFYSMAIVSQYNPKTQIDFRRYDYSHPNRTIPFSLPKYIEQSLLKLMQTLELQSAGIDMVYTSDNKYIFLEVNPFGQFGMVSKPCNYYLEEKIASYLIEMEINNKD